MTGPASQGKAWVRGPYGDSPGPRLVPQGCTVAGLPQDRRGRLAYTVVSDAHMRLWAARGHRHRGSVLPQKWGPSRPAPCPAALTTGDIVLGTKLIGHGDKAPVCQAPVSRAGPHLTPLQTVSHGENAAVRPTSLTGQAHRSHHACTDVRRNASPETETQHSGSAASAALQASCQPEGLSQRRGASTAQEQSASPSCCHTSSGQNPPAIGPRRTCSCHRPAASGQRPASCGAGAEHLLLVVTCSSQTCARTHLGQGTCQDTPEPGPTCPYTCELVNTCVLAHKPVPAHTQARAHLSGHT